MDPLNKGLLLDILWCEIQNTLALNDTSIVDEDCWMSKLLLNLLCDPFDFFPFRYITFVVDNIICDELVFHG